MSAPAPPSTRQLLLARHLDRVRRLAAPCREGLLIRELRAGWITRAIGKPPADYASASHDRVYWLALTRKLESTDIEQARNIATSIGIQRLFLWLAPWASDASTDALLNAAGASRIHQIQYIAFSRPAGEGKPPRPTAIKAEPLDPAFAQDILPLCEHWYSKDGIATALRMLQIPSIEVHAAFDGPKPIALGLLTIDGDWAYISAAGTDPDHRGQGAQSALICSRLQAAAAHGAAMCACETNTAVPISLRNLKRCGFVEAINWHVYQWDLQR
ncbi:MAG: GNAT family N-acetyltransferase [Phycisphaerales bacterium]|nr:GNAT family N-acetyltransferase [Phycisphaerales bacterium]